MRKWVAPLLVGGSAMLALGSAGVIGYTIAHTLTAPYSGRRYSTRIHSVTRHDDSWLVSLDDTTQSRRPGRYGAFLPDGAHIRFSTDVIAYSAGVTREVSAEAAEALAGVERVSWTGIEFPTPSAAGLHATDITIASECGPIPAWVIGDGTGGTWAVHVHGLGSSRAGTLRGVQTASELGLTSLIITYRNSAEGPRVGSGRSMLGGEEARDVERAVEYALEHGAERIILFGWSMGASIALRLAHDAPCAPRVIAVVAESPVLDWRATLQANLTHAGLPSWAVSLAYPWLTRPRLVQLLGLAREIDLDTADWSGEGRLQVPTLILQGWHDLSTPWQLAAKIASANVNIELELFDADHTMTWNSDPERWHSTVTAWLRPHLAESASAQGTSSSA